MTEITQRSLRALARLLEYPEITLQQAAPELAAALSAERRWTLSMRDRLGQWCERIAAADLLDLQAEYVALFDRGRATSLLLFEHVHGESRDRGQAMVDLLDHYQQAGFRLQARELPDYLPLFLEFLSTRREAEIGRWLGEIRAILARLAARLESREAPQALAVTALLALIGAESEIQAHRPEVSREAPDHTPQALDAVWEEEAVRFSAESDQDCQLQSAQGRHRTRQRQQAEEQPVRFVPPTAAAVSGRAKE